MTDVYLHIGLAKTGTTSIQDALQRNADRLEEAGVRYALRKDWNQNLAVFDLLGRQIPGDEMAGVPGSFQRLVDDIDAWTGPTVVISHETLALARKSHVRKLMKALRPRHRVFLILTMRDLGRAICSAWQQQIFQAGVYTWQDYLAAVRDPGEKATDAGVAFWLRQDVDRVLAKWEKWVPQKRVRIVTLPTAERGREEPHLLFDRFGTCLGLPEGTIVPPKAVRNPSVGAAELEAMRLMNLDLRAMSKRYRNYQLLKPEVRERIARSDAARIVLPASELPWVKAMARDQIARIKAADYVVRGNVMELMPVAPPAGARDPDDVTAEELLPATRRVLSVMADEHLLLWRRQTDLRARLVEEGRLGERVSHGVRSIGFRARQEALDASAENPLMRRLATWWFRRSGSGTR